MSAVKETIYPVVVTDWHGLYGEPWAGDLVAEAFQHPAKYSRALIRKIYAHAAGEGWIRPGSSVVDPFGGIAGGALDAMLRGCHWRGVELEPRFVELGRRNIELWDSRYSRMPSWGTAELRQGDSRQLARLFNGAELAVSSPPYADGCRGQGNDLHPDRVEGTRTANAFREGYSDTPANLGNLPATSEGFDCAISSPPFNDSLGNAARAPERKTVRPNLPAASEVAAYLRVRRLAKGQSKGQVDNLLGTRTLYSWYEGRPAGTQIPTPAHWLRLKEILDLDDRFDAGVLTEIEVEATGILTTAKTGHAKIDVYGSTDGQLGAQAGEDFWQASRLILEQLYQALAPGGHACFVTKRFVRRKQVVEFSAQWAAVCEAVGFRWLHHHRCWLVESHGTLTDLFGVSTELKTERKSFFRRLAEKKGSPRIDYEDCLCFVKETPCLP